MDGYGFPGGVEPGEDREAAATREVEEGTGLAVELDRPWLVDPQSFACGDRRRDGGHAVFYLAPPLDGAALADDPGVGDGEIEDAARFESVPDAPIQPGRVRAVLDGDA